MGSARAALRAGMYEAPTADEALQGVSRGQGLELCNGALQPAIVEI